MLAHQHPELLADPASTALAGSVGSEPGWQAALVAPIDPALADTAAFCAAYDVALEVSANCVVVAGKRAGEQRVAACVVLATTRADVNGVVKRELDVRKCSFLPVDEATARTGMAHGGITPLGLPVDWVLLVDAAVVDAPVVVIGAGVRAAKLVVAGSALAALPGVRVVPGLAG